MELKQQCEAVQASIEDKQAELRDKCQTHEELENTIRDLSAKKHAVMTRGYKSFNFN